MRKTAWLSGDRVYRYELTRTWDLSAPACAFIGLNPSTADETIDDPTIRRCIGFAKTWGYGTLRMLNLFALRSTMPQALRTHPDPVGPSNDSALELFDADLVVLAWGADPACGLNQRAQGVTGGVLLDGRRTAVLGRTKKGYPRHPLYLRGDCLPLDPITLARIPTPAFP